MLLLKDPSREIEDANIRGITVSSHISKPEHVVFYTQAFKVYELSRGAPYLVGGMKGISVCEVVCTAYMTLDQAHLRGQVVDVLNTDLGKYVDRIAQEVYLVAGKEIGPGTKGQIFAHMKGHKRTMQLRLLQVKCLRKCWASHARGSQGTYPLY